MTKIDNLAQAKETVEALSDFLNRFEQTLGALGSLTGNSIAPTAPAHAGAPPLRNGLPKRTPVVGTVMPDSMPERIFMILRSVAGRPLTIPEMVERHAQFGWAVPDRQALRKQIFASAYYLAKKKGRLTVNRGHYSIAAQEATPT